MTDYARIVDDIRSFLQCADQTLTDEIRALAEHYAAACRETNQRLRRCEDFLEKGLQSEAVHFAQAEPALLDVVALLDFPERRQWEEVSSMYGLPAPAKLMTATAEALNEAYGNIQPLQHLLRRHRLLALSRAPLQDRLAVMRELAALDSANPIWTEDITEFEAIRGRQIEADLREAMRVDDVQTVDTLVAEVRTASWLNGPPPSLLTTAQRVGQVREARRIQEMFRGLVHDLAAARQSGDVAAVKELQGRWNEAATRYRLPVDDPLRAEASPAFNWLEIEERRAAEVRKQRAAMIRLEETLLDKKATRPDLEKRYKAVLVHDGKVDPPLEDQYQRRLQAFDEQARQRRKFVVLSIAIASLLLGTGLIFWIMESRKAARAAAAITTIKNSLAAGELADARRSLDNFKEQEPDLRSCREIGELTRQVDTAMAAEQERVARFQEAIKAAEAAPADNADPASLSVARTLASTSAEKIAVDRLTRIRTERARDLTRQRETDFRAAVSRLDARVQAFEPLAGREPDADSTRDTLRRLQTELDQLTASGSGLREEVRDLAARLAARLDAIRSGISQEMEQKSLLAEISHALVKRDLMLYATLLQKFANHFPGGPRSVSFARAAKEKPLWDAEESWTRLIGPFKNRLFDLSPDEATELRGRLSDFLDAHRNFIDADVAVKCHDCVQSISQQDEKIGTSAAAKLRELFSNWKYKRLWFIVEDGNTYYVSEDPQVEKARRAGRDLIPVRYISDSMGNEKAHNPMLNHISSSGRCGASLLADLVAGMPPNFAGPSWDKAMGKILNELSTTPNMDPIVRLDLLRTVTDLAGKGSTPLSEAMADYKRALSTGPKDLSKLEWMVPQANLTDVRRSADSTLRRAANALNLKDLEAKVTARREEVYVAILHSMHDVAGGLSWQGNSGWQLIGPRLNGRWQLAVMVPVLGQDKPKWITVGEMENGKISLNTENQLACLEGRVVFARPLGP
jgi:hypothetical protein